MTLTPNDRKLLDFDEQEKKDFYERLDREYAEIPHHLRQSLWMYVSMGYAPGDFLRNVLENNLRGSFSHADSESQKIVGLLVKYLYNNFPIDAWGSWENVKAWPERVRGDKNIEDVLQWGTLWLRDSL